MGTAYYVPARAYPVTRLMAYPNQTLSADVITTTETAFTQTYTIPANFFKLGSALRVTLGVEEITSGSAATQRLRLRMGGVAGTAIYDSLAIAPTNSLVNRTVGGVFVLMGTAAPGASVAVDMAQVAQCTTPVTPFAIGNTIDQGVALATNGALVFTVTLQFGAGTAGNSVRFQSFIVEELQAP